MTKSGLMMLRELRCHVCIEREKKNLLQLKPVLQQSAGKKKKLLSILMTKMSLYKWVFKILGPSQFWGLKSLLNWLYGWTAS